MSKRLDDGVFIEMEKETKEKLRQLALSSERSMAAWVRNQINREFSKVHEPFQEAQTSS